MLEGAFTVHLFVTDVDLQELFGDVHFLFQQMLMAIAYASVSTRGYCLLWPRGRRQGLERPAAGRVRIQALLLH